MHDNANETNGSRTEWIEEMEAFLGVDSGNEPSLREKKIEILLHSITQMLEKNEDNHENGGKVNSVPKIRAKSRKTSQTACLLYFVLLCIFSFCAMKYGYCQGKSLKLCWNNNIQDWIYPVLRSIRLLALPLIRYFPSISGMFKM